MVKLHKPNEKNIREFKGTLVAHDKETITVSAQDGEQYVINKKDTVYIKLDDFNL